MIFRALKKKFIIYCGEKINTYKAQSILRLSILLATLVVFFYFLATSFFWYSLGNVFFGKYKELYNVTLSNIFFTNASYPLFGKPTSQAHFQLSRTYFIQGDLNIAVTEAKKELEIYPKNTKTYYILGLTYGYMNEEKKGIEAFTKYIETHPTTWAGRNDKAWLQFRIGDIDGALLTIEPVATSTGIYNVWVQNTYGTLLMNKGRYIEAKKAFNRAWGVVTIMTPESWGIAYPGNDPRIYSTGLQATQQSIQNNLKLIEEKMSTKRK